MKSTDLKLFLLLACFFFILQPVRAADGDLDTTYGTSGLVRNIETGLGPAVDIAVQNDDKSVVLAPKDNDFAVLRYNTDGSLDTTFGVGGEAIVDFDSHSIVRIDVPYAIAIQPDGKILVAGSSELATSGRSRDFAVARLNTDGSLDTTFGTSGQVTTNFGNSADIAYDLVVQGNGKIVVVGSATVNTNLKFGVVRYNDDGSIDTTFGNGGTKTFGWGHGYNAAYGVDLQSDGKIVVVGIARTGNQPQYDFAVARLRRNGKLDHTFGTAGRVATTFTSPPVNDSQATTVAVQADGKIVVGGGPYVPWGTYFLARYMSDGSLDPVFGVGGQVATAVATYSTHPTTVAISNGQIILGGHSTSSDACALVRSDTTLVRYLDDGSPDLSFGSAGVAKYNPYPADFNYCTSGMTAGGMALQSDGKIVVAGGDTLHGSYVGLILARFYN